MLNVLMCIGKTNSTGIQQVRLHLVTE